MIERVGARLYLDAPFPHPSPLYAALLQVLETRRIPVRQATLGRVIDLGGGATLTLLGPPEPPLAGTRSDANSNSALARLDHGRVSVLFAADAESRTEAWLLHTGARVRADVLRVAHHGSKYASSARFLRQVAPKAAVVSVGRSNPYGHPAPEVLARLSANGIKVWRTDLDGTITLLTDGETYDIRRATDADHVGTTLPR